jgi:hypothetical protein
MVMQRRGVLKGWTVTLVQASFLLTILGTFMTRSGVFNSVHSFTQSAIGPTILVVPRSGADRLRDAARAAHRLARERRAHRRAGQPRRVVPHQQPPARLCHLHRSRRHGLSRSSSKR